MQKCQKIQAKSQNYKCFEVMQSHYYWKYWLKCFENQKTWTLQ